MPMATTTTTTTTMTPKADDDEDYDDDHDHDATTVDLTAITTTSVAPDCFCGFLGCETLIYVGPVIVQTKEP